MRCQERSLPRQITHISYQPDGSHDTTCRITGWGPDGPVPARVRKVADSGDGTAWLVYGGEWGLRLEPGNTTSEWHLDAPEQWGEPFILLDKKP